MAIINETKKQLTKQFGSPKRADVLVGGDDWPEAGEAFTYQVGPLYITVGYRDGIACYACFAKIAKEDQKFDDRDVQVCLTILAPSAAWESIEFDCGSSNVGPRDDPETAGYYGTISEHRTSFRDPDGTEVRILAFLRSTRPYFLACRPRVDGPPVPDTSDSRQSPAETLDLLVARMNAAVTQETKLDAVIAVVNQLASRLKNKA